MSVITVETVRNYDVYIERGLLHDCGARIAKVVEPCKVAVITDDVVRPLYAAAAEDSLKNAGFTVYTYAYQNGEAQKTLETVGGMLAFLAQNEFTRTDIIVALGGGVCGDMAGFCAAVYLRGIRFVQIPTTLLAMVDSSVGGKTGFNLPHGKNLVGAFYQPELVLCDPGLLATLSPQDFSSGMAEVIKCGVISSLQFFNTLKDGIPQPATATSFSAAARMACVIESCIRIKESIVSKDEREKGLRKLLNFGHTVGHAIEKASGYTISHGHAVGMGMLAVTRASEQNGICKTPFSPALRDVLSVNAIPTEIPFFKNELCRAMCIDKKRSDNHITLVVPKKIGACTFHDVPLNELPAFFDGILV